MGGCLLRYIVLRTSASDAVNLTHGLDFATCGWTYIMVTRNGTGNNVTLYVNNIEAPVGSYEGTLGDTNRTTNIGFLNFACAIFRRTAVFFTYPF